MTARRHARAVFATAAMLGASRALFAQSGYYNLDGSRPLRVEDAIPTERHALDIEFTTVRMERYADGSLRWRAEPKLSYGAFPLTEIELRVPLIAVEREWLGRPRIGAAGIAVGAMRAFSIETGAMPALALGAELLIPAGPLSGPTGSWSLKGLLTRTLSVGRLQLNAAYGTYSVRTRPVAPIAGFCNPTIPNCVTVTEPPFDFPCAPPNGSGLAITACAHGRLSSAAGSAAPPRFDPARSYGAHWVAGAGFDHAFGLRSTLVGADIVAERFAGLYSINDWTAEAGMRKQLTPSVILDAGVGRHFAGVVQSTSATLGLTVELALRPPGGL